MEKWNTEKRFKSQFLPVLEAYQTFYKEMLENLGGVAEDDVDKKAL